MQIGLQRNGLIPADHYSRHDLCERGIMFLVIRPIEDRDRLKGMSPLTPILGNDIWLAMQRWATTWPGDHDDGS